MRAAIDTSSALAQCHIDKGVIKAEDLTAMIEELESYGSRGLGARIIARCVVPAIFLPPISYIAAAFHYSCPFEPPV